MFETRDAKKNSVKLASIFSRHNIIEIHNRVLWDWHNIPTFSLNARNIIVDHKLTTF